MKKLIEKFKKSKKFTKIMIGYGLILTAAVIVLCIWEWNKLSDYQGRYDEAEKSSSPELYADRYVESFDRDKFVDILDKAIESDNDFYDRKDIIGKITDGIDFGSIRYEKNESIYSEKSPVYDIYSDDVMLMTLHLGVKKRDSFGFNVWKEKEIEIKTKMPESTEVQIILSDKMKAEVNGVIVGEEYAGGSVYGSIGEVLSNVTDRKAAYKKYTIYDILDMDDLKVYDEDGKELTYTEKENSVRDYTLLSDEETAENIKAAADKSVTSYIYYINRYNTIDDALSISREGSEASKIIRNMYGAVVWIYKPLEIQFTRKDISDIRLIEDELAVCSVEYDMHKKYDEEYSGYGLTDEAVKYIVVLKNVNGNWMLENINMQ